MNFVLQWCPSSDGVHSTKSSSKHLPKRPFRIVHSTGANTTTMCPNHRQQHGFIEVVGVHLYRPCRRESAPLPRQYFSYIFAYVNRVLAAKTRSTVIRRKNWRINDCLTRFLLLCLNWTLFGVRLACFVQSISFSSSTAHFFYFLRPGISADWSRRCCVRRSRLWNMNRGKLRFLKLVFQRFGEQAFGNEI